MAANPPLTIISGGQTGVDRAALDFAIRHGIPHEGWCPRGRKAEDGRLDSRYQLRETPTNKYAQRTEWNIRDSDGTVVFTIDSEARGGTALTLRLTRKLGRPCLHLARDDASQPHAAKLREFLAEHRVRRLNVAGPRSSQQPEAAAFAAEVLKTLLGDGAPDDRPPSG